MPFDYTGSFSGSFYGDITASNGVISSSAQLIANLPSGVLSSSAQVNYNDLQRKPTTISPFQASSIIANSNFRENTFPTVSASIADDINDAKQILTLNGRTLSISSGNSVLLPEGGGSGGGSIWSTGSYAPTSESLASGSFDFYLTQNNLVVTGSLSVTRPITGSLYGTADTASFISDTFISASAVRSGFGSGGEITYISESENLSLSQIEVADFDDNVAVTFTGGKLKFIFGSPTVPSSLNSTLSGFATDRFNKVTDGYNVNGSWNNGGYTLISASLFEGATLLTQVGSGTSLSYSTTTSGSHTYKLEYTASSPLDGTIYTSSDTVSGTLSKSNPGNPSISATPSVQLGASSNQIEQGATGSITFSVSYGSSNSWEQVSLSSTPTSSPIYVTGSATGSSSIVIGATAEYQSPAGDNDPQISSTRTNSTTYSKIRSVRYGASAATSFTQSELEDLSSWDTSLGGSIGTIDKGNTTPSGDTITITWTGNKYHYIVFDSSRSDLTNITTSGFGVLASFTKSVVGNYKIYRSNDLQSDSGGGSITYVLT